MLYDLLKICVSICFNIMNRLLGGNLPPFGSAAVVVEKDDLYLVVELPRKRLCFPGGFMNWREQPAQTARREGKEETGLDLKVGDLISMYTLTTTSWLAMSTISFVYQGEVVGGRLQDNMEGRPCWLPELELRKRCSQHTLLILDDYLRYRNRQDASWTGGVATNTKKNLRNVS